MDQRLLQLIRRMQLLHHQMRARGMPLVGRLNVCRCRLYPPDAQTNVTRSILSRVGRGLHQQPAHPLGIMAGFIREYFGARYAYHDAISPIVSPAANFESLCFPADHPGRSRSDSYYLNRDWMLRTHTSAHQAELIRGGNDRFLLTADVYRRDEIDRTHYPVFHQVEGVCLFPQHAVEAPSTPATAASPANACDTNPRQPCYRREDSMAVEEHLKASLEGMVRHLFARAASHSVDGAAHTSSEVQMRWVDAYFPFTSPSYELEVWYNEQWMEILGCGVINHSILERAGRPDAIGWAFGIGLERLAMALFRIPDIRLFWSEDARFLGQFSPAKVTHFRPFSPYPSCTKDISFWLPPATTAPFHPNDLFELVRDMAGDLVEDVKLVDQFVHPKTGRESHCYRIMYRSMDRNVTNEEINDIQARVREHAPKRLQVELR
ncbi:phenylalanyl-tRNA synthetase [Syncephalis pseudoplumigaleata]|uniref:Phenylalanine--tRNA ligase, mitochondrial n=1 Tax=Syncephalis pseudoplumigaleata TaxID=1712513 RepID=A0A4P9Z499_9FUNG|nr:phenylalanyl-tRNA synthetase [Syncephalis pseudoplumigaleata]|eukprot:RKP27275.1 phenylalanyl-tRNA synthetase [Syncephalis pseudoplumigaleata]